MKELSELLEGIRSGRIKIVDNEFKQNLIKTIVDELDDTQWKICGIYIVYALSYSGKSPFYTNSNIRRIDLKNILWDCGSITNSDDGWLAFIHHFMDDWKKASYNSSNSRIKSYYSSIESKLSELQKSIASSDKSVPMKNYVDTMIDIMMFYIMLHRKSLNDCVTEFRKSDFELIGKDRSHLSFYCLSIILIELGLEAQGQ